MKVNINYKSKSVELDIPDEKLEELVKEKKTGWEKPLNSGLTGSLYYYINKSGEVCTDNNHGFEICDKCYERGNCFTSGELAKNIARYQSLDLRIRRRIAEICEPVDWSDGDSCKVYIYYDHCYKKLDVSGWYGCQYSGWHCDTKAHAEQIIEEFKDELTWYFTEFKDRMDG